MSKHYASGTAPASPHTRMTINHDIDSLCLQHVAAVVKVAYFGVPRDGSSVVSRDCSSVVVHEDDHKQLSALP